MADAFDVLVIGSGFGGSVTGCRLAQAGRSVCILERGKRWTREEFPRSVNDIRNAVWAEDNAGGLLDYRSFKNMDVIAGTGVGGGSLVYFNVHLETPPGIFDKGWPEGISREVLDPFYDVVRKMIGAKPLAPPPGMDKLPRTRAFFHAAEKVGKQPRLLNIAVYTGPDRDNPEGGVPQGGCVYCSNDLLGCHVHAKNTLDLNYLPLAEKHGAEIRPYHLATKIEPASNGRFVVTYRDLSSGTTGTIEAQKVIVAAGTLGSNELLLRCRDVHKTLPKLSNMLGHGYSGNGDFLMEATWDTDMDICPTDGPSITAGADFSTEDNSIFIEDLGFPDVMAWYLEGLLPSTSGLRRVWTFFTRYILQRMGLYHDSRLAAHVVRMGSATTIRMLPYLGMGTDAADGEFRLKNGQLDLRWSPRNSRKMYNEMEDALKRLSTALGGKYITSPLWIWPLRKLLTAHPLGGCRMADSKEQGVVNEYGEVWDYPNLYVIDGASIPTALGVNPSMTIAALAERAAQNIADAGQ